MTTDIFIRTYSKDIEWLNHALKSIHDNVRGFRNIVIAIPKGQGKLLNHLTAETVIEVEDMADGYLGQQLTKMEAWKYTDADFIVFWDSDVIAKQNIDISNEYFKDGKPIIYKTPYASINAPWKPITEKAVGFSVQYEYMRRLPLVYDRETLKDSCIHVEHMHGRTLRSYLGSQPRNAFSEFNVIGAIAEKYHAEKYNFIDTTTVNMPPNKVEQFWSWGGVTKEVKEKISSYSKN